MPPHSLPDLEALRIDAFLVSSLHNIRYLSGFTGSNGLLLIGRGAATLYTDPRYDIQAAQECSCGTKVVKGSLYTAALDAIRRRRFRRIGFERNNIGYGAYAMLEDGIPAGAKLIAIGGFIERLRTVKSAEEIDLIRRSVDLNSRAYDRAMARVKPSISESDLAAELEYQMRRNGAEKPAFETIVAAGARSALPHAQPSSARLETGRLLLVDMGAVLGGYSSDMTRMAHLGKPAPKTRRLYNAVLEAQLAALDTVRAGVTADRVDRAARNTLKRHGMDKFFVHSTGHGLGLEIHEPPRLGRREKTVLEAGMTITIEPGAYLEGFGGVRIEDTVLVTKTGCEVLTPTGKELMQL